MTSLSLCRTCLTFSSKMHDLRYTELQETFEKVTNKRSSEGAMVCYICYALLLKYHKFEDMSWKSEMVLSELTDKGIKITHEIVTKIRRHPLYSVTPVEYFNIGFKDTTEVKHDPVDEDYQIVVKEESIETEESELHKNFNGDMRESTLKQEPYVEDIIIKEELEELWLEEDIDVEGEVTLGCESIVKSEDIILEEEYVDIEHIDRKEHFLSPSSNKITKEPQKKNRTEKLNKLLNTQTEKVYTCDICSKTFSTKKKIKNHVTTHSQYTRDKPYNCHICGHRFTYPSTLKRHSIVHADKNNTDLKTFACNICNKKFFRRYHLKGHLTVHTGSKPFKCSICKHSFSQKCSLIGHMRIHTGEKTHYCSKCNKGFYRKGHLHQHMIVHEEDTPYRCNRCGKRYKTNRSLVQHSCKLKTQTPL